MIHNLKILFFLATLLVLCGFSWTKTDWDSINRSIDNKYPSIASISTESLKEKLERQDTITIIDVREPDEFKVSHLPKAINETDPKTIDLPLETTIIVYCSVGLRSAKFAKTLKKHGYVNILNLRGSIFEWANNGYPLKRGEQTVTVVHPYNKKWGSLVKKSLHAYHVQ
jgi:rhodanese-related sulfurtransferase